MERLEEIKKRWQFLVDQEQAAQRSKEVVPVASLYLGLCGINFEQDCIHMYDGFFELRHVSNTPGIVHVCKSANYEISDDYLSVSRYAPSIHAEVAVGCNHQDLEDNVRFLLDMSWHLVALMKLLGCSNLFCPCCASVSWDTIAIAPNNSVRFTLLDDTPRRLLNKGAKQLSKQEINWIDQHFIDALDLRNFSSSRRFGLAFNIAYTWNYTDNYRIALSQLWCGLDALFGCKTDRPVTKVLLGRINDWLPKLDTELIRYLYDIRSDAVHGRYFQNDIIEDAINKTVDILRTSLIKCIETKSKTLPDWE